MHKIPFFIFSIIILSFVSITIMAYIKCTKIAPAICEPFKEQIAKKDPKLPYFTYD